MGKIEFINKSHTNKISYNEKRGLYYTRVGQSKKISAKTEEDLINKLYLYYGGIEDFSFRAIFEKALEQHQQDADNSKNTLARTKKDYKRFISDEFGEKDIREIKSSDIDAYIFQYLKNYETENHKSCTTQVLYALKGLFNLVFRYATSGDTPIISANPVPQDNTKYLKHTQTPHENPEKKAFQPDDIEKIKELCWQRAKHNNNYVCSINALAVLLSIETGMRTAELCALQWSDISDKNIHIHAQILTEDEKESNYYYAGWTKNEKGHSRGGRRFPITNNIREIIEEITNQVTKHNVKSDYLFARKNGTFMTPQTYKEVLRKITKEVGTAKTNNHAFRIALNSYVLIPRGITAPERARLLGHSVEVNLKHYTYALANANDEIREILNGTETSGHPINTSQSPNIIDFQAKKETLKAAKLKGFQ